MRNPLAVLVVLALLSAAVLGQCPSNGLTLTFAGERLGDPWALNLYGAPGASGVLAVDDTGGPVLTPIGPVCLGLTPNLQLLDFQLDGTGQFGMGGLLPPSPSLINFTAFLQAAAPSPSIPGGFAVSNGASLKLRPPRVFFIHPGYASPFGSTPGAFCGYDALGDVVFTPAIQLAGLVQDAIMIPALNWIAFLLGNGTVACYDAHTGAPTLTIPVATTPSYAAEIAVEGTTLYALHRGMVPSPFSGGTPGALTSYSLPTGTPGFTCNLSSGNPNGLLVLPGTGAAYLRLGSNIVPVSLVSGIELPWIVLGGAAGEISEWVLGGTVLYCLLPGQSAGIFGSPAVPPEIASINTFTHTVIHTATALNVPSGPATMIRYGPGTLGNPSLFVYVLNNPVPMLEVNPNTLAISQGIPMSTFMTEMVLSPGGTEWLLLEGAGASHSLHTMVPPTLALTQITPLLPPTTLLTSVPNWTTRRALMLYNNNVVLPFSTDFTQAPFYTVTLPLASAGRVVVD
jgi:hypothetical protein